MDELVHTYSEMASKYRILKEAYPYSEPREHVIKESKQCIVLLREIKTLEMKALSKIKELCMTLGVENSPR